MRVLLVNGSPKAKDSASDLILKAIKGRLGEGHSYTEIQARGGRSADEDCLGQDIILLAFPLYVDALPSGLLEWLISFEALLGAANPIGRAGPMAAVFAICNCGFYEGEQTESALRIVANFASRCGLAWGGGLGIGTGGMIEAVAGVPDQVWIKREVSGGLSSIAHEMGTWEGVGKASQGHLSFGASVRYLTHGLPRGLYLFSAHAGWRKMAKANGLRGGDLRARPIIPR